MGELSKGQHISQEFDTELREIHEKVLSMGHLVEQQIRDVLSALMQCDTDLARQVINRDYQVNAYEVGIDEQCTRILARRQPTGGDLRCLISVVKTITDLERMGDEAKNIAYQVLAFECHESYTGYLVEIEHLGKEVMRVLRQSIEIFEKLNAGAAAEVICEDSRIDKQYGNINRQLLTYMMEDARNVPHILELMWTARALERVADRACNICNYVVYCVKGELTHSR